MKTRSVTLLQFRERASSVSIKNRNEREAVDAMARRGQQFLGYGVTIVLTVIGVHLVSNLLEDDAGRHDGAVAKDATFPGPTEGLILTINKKWSY